MHQIDQPAYTTNAGWDFPSGIGSVNGLLCLGATQVRAASLSYCDTISSNLVVNCGFETGDFTAWSLSGNDVPGEQGNLYGVEGTDPINNTSPDGSYQAYIADLVSNSTTLSQSLATVAGDEYAISFFLLQDTAPVGGYSKRPFRFVRQ